MSRKHRCCICDKEAKWYNSFCNKTYQKYYCDEHVPRNCINNVDNLEDFGEPKTTNKIMWWDKNSKSQDLMLNGSLERTENSFYYEILTEDGRRNPSDDFEFNENGFLKEENTSTISNYHVSMAYKKYRRLLSPKEKKEFEDVLINAYNDYEAKYGDNVDIEYNFLMSRIGDFIKHKVGKTLVLKDYNDNLRKFFNGLKTYLREYL